MTTDERLLRLERELSKVRRICLLLFLLLLAGLMSVLWPYLTRSRYKEIRAQAFVVEDADGRKRGEFNSTGSLNLMGESGSVVLTTFGTSMLSIGSHEAQALLTVSENASLELRDEMGKPRAVLGSTRTVTPDGRQITEPVSSLLLFAPDGKVIYQAPLR